MKDPVTKTFRRTNRILSVISVLLICVTLTSCMPGGYTKEKKKSITKEHSTEAKDWFKENMPDAKVRSAAAYANGIDLFAVITGKYAVNGTEYDYFYDYYNGDMYLEQPYIRMQEEARLLLADYLGADESDVELRTSEYSFLAFVENDSDSGYGNNAPYGSFEYINGQNILPYDADPAQYAKMLLEDGFEKSYVTYAEVYIERIPEYERMVFDKLKGLTSIEFISPADWEYDGVYMADYSAKKAEYTHLKLTEVRSGIYCGYTYKDCYGYDETGALTDHTDEAEGYDPSGFYSDTGEYSFVMHIPGRGQPLIFAKKKSKVICRNEVKPGEIHESPFSERGLLDHKYSDDTTHYYYDIVLPSKKLTLYTQINATDSDGIYDIMIE